MYIKAQTQIPVDFKVTKVASSEGKGRNIYSLLKAEESRLEKQAALKIKANKFSAALKVGYTVQEALKLAQSDK